MLLSIITINFNNGKGLRRTIESVINQCCKDYEYIIIDGGSTDDSIDIIRQYEDRISYWVSEKDNGIYNAMNKGISIAKGEYCNFLNSGDYYFPDTINILSQYKGEDICVGNTRCFYPNQNKNIIWRPPSSISFADIVTQSLNHQAAFIRTTLMKELKYDENYKIIADWDFFIRALVMENCTYKKIDAMIVNYELGGISTQNMSLYQTEKKEMFSKHIPYRIYYDYKNIFITPNNYIKPLLYNRRYRILRISTMVFAYIISIPIRFCKRIKYRYF